MVDEERIGALRSQFIESDATARDALLLELYIAMTLAIEAAAANLRHVPRSTARNDVGRSLLAMYESLGTLAAFAGAPDSVFEIPTNLDAEWHEVLLGEARPKRPQRPQPETPELERP
jgi:hypothetical protein